MWEERRGCPRAAPALTDRSQGPARRGRRHRRIRQYDQGEVTRADGVERQNLRRTSVALTDFCYAIHNRAVGNRGQSSPLQILV